jgi:hypothetical protein
MLIRRIVYLLVLIAWEVVIRLPLRLLGYLIIIANVWAWHVIFCWLFLPPLVVANRAGIALATLLFTLSFRRRLFWAGIRTTGRIYAVLALIVLVLLWIATPLVAGLLALVGGLRNDADIVVFAGTLLLYGFLWLAIVGKFYEIFEGIATLGQGSVPVRRDPEIPIQESADQEARAILIKQYREGF